ncbi:MAG: YifB family Mg chelatase-like AAA ATPase [Maricaulaceae bacterium]|jgi:magnesium chelatase family protein
MVARIGTVAFEGAEAKRVDVQVQLVGEGKAFLAIVGLADKSVAEARERVRAAFAAIGLSFPGKQVIVNLAPADLPKDGGHYDLPIALGLMAEMGILPKDELEGYVAIGELGLDGAIAQVAGALPAAMAANGEGLGLICPEPCGPEAAWAGSMDILAATSLMAVVNHFKGVQVLSPPKPGPLEDGGAIPDLRDVKGQENAKRALEVAAAGGHNLLFIGPPGSGKSMMAARLPGLLPPLSAQELLEVSMIHSVAGLLERGRLTRRRPFRAPHHSASMAALVGGGVRAKPGEASLAHRGVLFLDELPEFNPAVLDSLRAPMETGRISIARANRHVSYPADFQLIAAMNPCRCGGQAGADGVACRRGPRCAADYQARVSGPMMDRIDLQVEAPPVTPADLALPPPPEGTAEAAARVAAARGMQTERAPDSLASPLNAALDGDELTRVAAPDETGAALLAQATQAMNLTARGYVRVLRVARTIADLDGADGVRRRHVAEALSFRRALSAQSGTGAVKVP